MDKPEIDFDDIDVNESDNESVESVDENKNMDNEDEFMDDDEIESEEEDEKDDNENEIEDNDDDDIINDGNEDDKEIDNDKIMNNDVLYEDSDDDDDLEEDYLQKFDKDVKTSIIQSYHPEMIVHNQHEIKASCVVVRDSQGNIIDPLHKTLPFVTCYERARVIGERAKQIEAGAKPFVELPPNIIDAYLIALKEFENKKIPFIIQRPLPNGTSEYWKLSDLEIL